MPTLWTRARDLRNETDVHSDSNFGIGGGLRAAAVARPAVAHAVRRRMLGRVWMKRIFLLAYSACYLAFAYALYHRWLATEIGAHGPVPFAALLGAANSTSSGGAYPARLSWSAVLTPLWTADVLAFLAHATLLLAQPSSHGSTLNAKLEHAGGMARAVLYAAFKVLLLGRLENASSPPTSWFCVFSPSYAAAILQMVLHSCKTLEGGETLFRGRDASRPRRRPGFALTLDDTLAFNISLHLNGVFYLRNATWSIVFWPLWLVAAICGVGLFLLLCFGVPMLSRRCTNPHAAKRRDIEYSDR